MEPERRVRPVRLSRRKAAAPMTRMSLRTRIVLIVALVAVAFSAGGYAFQRWLVYEQILEIERKAAIDDLRRCEDAVDREIEHLVVFCADWAAWDDMYDYFDDRNSEFFTANLTDSSMANVRCDAEWLVALDGTVLFANARQSETHEPLSFPEVAGERFPLDHPLLRPRALDEPVSGIVRTSHGPLLIASRQVVTSELTGPARGWFVGSRLLTPAALALLSEQTHVRFEAWQVDDPARDPASDHVLAAAQDVAPGPRGAHDPRIDDADDDTLHVYGHLDDLSGRPAVVLRADVPRDISKRGADSMRLTALSVVAAGVGMVAVLLVLLGATIVTPLRRLSAHAVRIGRSDDLRARSGIVRGDEIGALAGAFDDMVGRLSDSRSRLADAARRAGVADMARGVLHNVGNLLTGVSVSAAAVAAANRTSRVDGVLRGADLVAEHRDDLARFLAEDPRGRMLPGYLAQAAAACRQERSAVSDEIETLQRGVSAVTEIVARQLEFAVGPSIAERQELETAVAGAIALVEPGLRRQSVALVRQVEAGREVVVDRMKLTQVLVNLLTNAGEAVASTDPARRRVVVRASVDAAGSADSRIRIAVEDTGCGIAPDDVGRVFESGFSTKGPGRGLGLHYCAVAVGEMGGALHAASDGPGAGAVFTLDLPQHADGAGTARRESETPAGSAA